MSTAYKTQTQQVSAQFVNSNFVRKIEDGRTKEAQDEGTAFIRQKLRQESFAREIIEPVMLGDDEIDRDENTDQPKKIVEKEPDSVATFVPFHGTAARTWFRGKRFAVYFGKTESQRFTKNKFELMTYQNDIRKILSGQLGQGPVRPRGHQVPRHGQRGHRAVAVDAPHARRELQLERVQAGASKPS
jgi:hypothetical protein